MGTQVSVAKSAVEAAKGALENEKSSFGGFSTGFGTRVQVEKSAVLGRARQSSEKKRVLVKDLSNPKKLLRVPLMINQLLVAFQLVLVPKFT